MGRGLCRSTIFVVWKTMISYHDLLHLNGDIRYERSGNGHLKMAGTDFPLSIKETEFNFIHDLIVQNNFVRGFEVATAFGISALAAGLAFSKTGGTLVTMDAYIEEHSRDPEIYRHAEPVTYENMKGYQSVQFLRSHFSLESHLVPVVGWSPRDVPHAIQSQFGTDLLDYAFIDAGHFEHAIINDITAIAPFMRVGGTMVFHDVYPWSVTPTVHKLIHTLSGNHVTILIEPPEGENMGFVLWQA